MKPYSLDLRQKIVDSYENQEVEILTTLVEEDNDATLPQLAQRLEVQTNLRVSNSTISRGIQKLNLTRKKNS